MNLYGRFIQIAGDLRRWQVHTLTDHVVFSFQANVFIAGNKQGTERGFEIQAGSGRRNSSIPVLGGSQGQVVICRSPEHNGLDASTCPQAVIFSSAPGGQLFSQEPAQALSVVSETKALTYTLLARLITFYLKLKFSNS